MMGEPLTTYWPQILFVLLLAAGIGEARFRISTQGERIRALEAETKAIRSDEIERRERLQRELEGIRLALVRIETRLGIGEA